MLFPGMSVSAHVLFAERSVSVCYFLFLGGLDLCRLFSWMQGSVCCFQEGQGLPVS